MNNEINDSQKNEYYDYAISLGWFCGMAAAMRLVGIRSFSSPFDWIFSDFKSVLKHIDDNFSDFLVKENIVLNEKKPKIFKDSMYNYDFMHDVSNDFEHEWDAIKSKYNRRIKRFIDAIHRKTCLFRCVRNEDEIAYIESHRGYIDSIVKKYNTNNKIIYILLNGMKFSADFQGEFYHIDEDEYTMRVFMLAFKRDVVISKVCEHLICPAVREKNLQDMPNLLSVREIAAVFIYYLEKQPALIINLIKEKLDIDLGLYVWGAGDYGTALANILTQYNIKVKGFIDSDLRICGKEINGIQVYNFRDIANNGDVIFIAIADINAVNLISNSITAADLYNDVISFIDFRNEIVEMLT